MPAERGSARTALCRGGGGAGRGGANGIASRCRAARAEQASQYADACERQRPWGHLSIVGADALLAPHTGGVWWQSATLSGRTGTVGAVRAR